MADELLEPKEQLLEIGEPLELQAIKNILTSRSFLVSVIENIHPEFFENFTARIAVMVIKEHFTKYSDIPTADIIKVEAKKFFTPKDDEALFNRTLDQIANLGIHEEEYLRNKLIEHCQFQALRKAIFNSINLLSERKEDYKIKIADSIKKAFSIVDLAGAGLNYFHDPRERLTTELKYKKHIPTGILKLDGITGGGWSLEDTPLVIIVAPTGFGKSIMLCKFGSWAVLKGFKVIHITHELSETRTAARYDSLIGHVGQSQRLTDIERVVTKLNLVKDAYGENLRIKEFPTKTCTPNQLRAYLEKIRDFEDFKPDIVINDYLDLMVANNNAYPDNDYAAQKRVSEELRAVAQEYQVPIITASQTNREGADDKELIKGVDIAESFGKVMTADMIVTMGASSEERIAGMASLFVSKYRNGVSGSKVIIKIDYEMMNIIEPTETIEQGAVG
jgi:replicative DNA helicase